MTKEKMLTEIANKTGREIQHVFDIYKKHSVSNVNKIYQIICGGK